MSSNLSECPLAFNGRFIPKAPATSISSPMKTIDSPYLSARLTIPFCIALLYVHEFAASENLMPTSPIDTGLSPPERLTPKRSNCSE